MTTVTIDPAVRALAHELLSPKQLEAWTLIHIHHMSLRGAAAHLAVHRTTFVDRYDAACLNLRKAGAHIDASGNYHLQETA